MKKNSGTLIILFLMMGLSVILFNSCTKDETPTPDGNTVSDIDGNVYQIVTIGTQVWMKENLKTTKYRDGSLIGTTTPATLDISGVSNPKYQWAYEGNESNVATYGRLYTWYAATDSRKVCPAGWHISTDIELSTIITFLGGESVAGGKLKELGTAHWQTPNRGATNESVFTALPSGTRDVNNNFNSIGDYLNLWSATESDASGAWYRGLLYNGSDVYRSSINKRSGFSVRCLRDF